MVLVAIRLIREVDPARCLMTVRWLPSSIRLATRLVIAFDFLGAPKSQIMLGMSILVIRFVWALNGTDVLGILSAELLK